MDTWCNHLQCVCPGSEDLTPFAGFGCAAVPIGAKSSVTLNVALRATKETSRMASQPSIYLLKQGRLPWVDDELVHFISSIPATPVAAKSIAAFVYGGHSTYDRWARAKNTLMRATWASPDAWERGTQYNQEIAIVYRTVLFPQNTRDAIPLVVCRMRLTQKEDVPFEYKGRQIGRTLKISIRLSCGRKMASRSLCRRKATKRISMPWATS